MIKKNEKTKYIYYTLYIITLIILIFFVPVSSLDEISNLRFGIAPHEGCLWYKDCNILVLPFSAILTYIFTFFSHSIYMLRLLNAIIYFLTFYFLNKISQKYTTNNAFLFISSLFFILLEATFEIYYYDYNNLSFLLILIILYFIQKDALNYKNAFIIASVCCLLILTKHTTGFVFFLITTISLFLKYYKEESFNKKILFMLLVGIIYGIMTLSFLYFTDTLTDFFNLGFNTNFVSNIIIDIRCVHSIIILLSIIIILNILNKKINKDKIIVYLYWIGFLCIIFPIIDLKHLSYFILYAFMLININLLHYDIDKHKIINYILTLIKYFLCCIYIFSLLFYANFNNTKYLRYNDINNISGTLISEDYYNNIQTYKEYISKADTYIISKKAIAYTTTTNQFNNYYDLLWNGNTGNNEPLEYVKELINTDTNKNKYIFVSCDNEGNLLNNIYQWDINMDKYIDEHCLYIETKNNFRIYQIQ